MKLELIYDSDCPNVNGAREKLAAALRRLELPEIWQEHCRQDPHVPNHTRDFGSPTILLDGKDIAPGADGGNACRLYRDQAGQVDGSPPFETIIAALRTRKEDR